MTADHWGNGSSNGASAVVGNGASNRDSNGAGNGPSSAPALGASAELELAEVDSSAPSSAACSALREPQSASLGPREPAPHSSSASAEDSAALLRSATPPLGGCACAEEEQNGAGVDAIEPNGTARTGIRERDEAGRFALGNRAALGHGGAAHNLARWRRLAHEATTDEDHLEVWRGLIECAKNREPWAVVVYLNYTHGRPPPHQVADELDKGEMMRQEFRRIQERLFAPEEVVEMAERYAGEELQSLRAQLQHAQEFQAKLLRERSEWFARMEHVK